MDLHFVVYLESLTLLTDKSSATPGFSSFFFFTNSSPQSPVIQVPGKNVVMEGLGFRVGFRV